MTLSVAAGGIKERGNTAVKLEGCSGGVGAYQQRRRLRLHVAECWQQRAPRRERRQQWKRWGRHPWQQRWDVGGGVGSASGGEFRSGVEPPRALSGDLVTAA